MGGCWLLGRACSCCSTKTDGAMEDGGFVPGLKPASFCPDSGA
jgi:hypothetical protein